MLMSATIIVKLVRVMDEEFRRVRDENFLVSF